MSFSKIRLGLGVILALCAGCTKTDAPPFQQDAGLADDGEVVLEAAPQTANAVEIYFIRHAETEKNAKISDNENAFSPEGLIQIDHLDPPGLTQRLMAYNIEFDAILVSPKWRAQHTILPYLRRTGKKAVIWPELEECCWQEDQTADVSSAEVKYVSGKIKLEDSEYFSYREDKSSQGWDNKTFGDGIRQVERGVDVLQAQFARSGQKILLVGHYHSGGRILQRLLGRSIREEITLSLSNAKLQHLSEQGADDFFSFKLVEAER